MNKFLALLCLCLMGFIVWREQATLAKWKNEAVTKLRNFVDLSPEAFADEKEPPPATMPEQTDKPPAPQAPPPPPVAVLLPEPPPNVYYLRERIKFDTGVGITAYEAGLEVTKSGEQAGLAVVSAGKGNFNVDPAKLTRDMKEVAAIRRRAAESRTQLPAEGRR